MKIKVLSVLFALASAAFPAEALHVKKHHSHQQHKLTSHANIRAANTAKMLYQLLGKATTTIANCKRAGINTEIQIILLGRPAEKVATEKCLGSGGFGEVWLARKQNGEAVALKIQDGTSPITEEEFLEKAQGVDGVVKLDAYGACTWTNGGADRKGRCMALELLGDGDLQAYERKTFIERGGIKLPDALRMFRSLAKTLDDLHNHDIIHNDLKPENVMLKTDEEGVKQTILVDFGLATNANAMKFAGTAGYMPEEYKRDGRSDVYSLGLVLWTLVDSLQAEVAIGINCQQWPGETPAHKTPSRECQDPKTWPEFEAVPNVVKDLFVRMTERKRESRITMKEVIEQVDDILLGLETHGLPEPTREEKEKKLEQRRVLWTAAKSKLAQIEHVQVQVDEIYQKAAAERAQVEADIKQKQEQIDELKAWMDKSRAVESYSALQAAEQKVNGLERDIEMHQRRLQRIDEEVDRTGANEVKDLIPKLIDTFSQSLAAVEKQINQLEHNLDPEGHPLAEADEPEGNEEKKGSKHDSDSNAGSDAADGDDEADQETDEKPKPEGDADDEDTVSIVDSKEPARNYFLVGCGLLIAVLIGVIVAVNRPKKKEPMASSSDAAGAAAAALHPAEDGKAVESA